jgi:ABC-2 type transport system permease protein
MTAATLDPRSAQPAPTTGPGPARLTQIEMRKFVDTRSGLWLLVVIGLLSGLLVAVQLIWGGHGDGNFAGFLEPSLFPVGVLLPVLGVLTVTTEWSHRTALTTFTLVPRRRRILVAKLAAAVIFALASVVVSLAFAAIGTALAGAFDRGDGSWSLPAATIGQAVVFQVLNVVMGVGFGMLLLSSPVAIVSLFVIPAAFMIITQLVTAIKDVLLWLDINTAMGPLSSGSMTGPDWEHLGTSSLLWIVVPLAIGGIRLLRREVT